jgi:5-methylcytosine-specific restriction endonuclease McrA
VGWLQARHREQKQIQRRAKTVGTSQAKGNVNVKSVLRLVEKQQFRCALTGRPLTPDQAALDHKVPVCRGGKHDIENAQVLHRDVNRAKGALTNEEFIQLCREVAEHAAQHNPEGEER